jgi:hypothetical protein
MQRNHYPFIRKSPFPFAIAAMAMSIWLGCVDTAKEPASRKIDWNSRTVKAMPQDSLIEGSTYLAVYSEIYSITEKRTHHLTVTVSMRNISGEDSVFVQRADHYNTAGELVRSYFEHPIFIAPLETVEIVLGEGDTDGGTGGNFIFEWATRTGKTKPLFEAIMISTSGQQGLSFTSQGVER